MQRDQRVLLLRGRRLHQLTVAVAGEAFAVEGATGSLAAALADFFRGWEAPGAFQTIRFIDDGRAVPSGVRSMPVVRGASITGAGFEFRDGVLTGANERFGIESVLKVLLARRLLARGALLVHAVAVGGAVFVAESGSGKSTLGALARASGLPLLADELVVLDGPTVHGTPWNTGTNASAPLKTLGALGWADAPRLEPVPAADFLPLLMSNTLLPDESPAARAAVFRAAAALVRAHPPRRFFFAPNASAADFLRAQGTSTTRPNPGT